MHVFEHRNSPRIGVRNDNLRKISPNLRSAHLPIHKPRMIAKDNYSKKNDASSQNLDNLVNTIEMPLRLLE